VRVADIGKHLPIILMTNPGAIIHWQKAAYPIEMIYSAAVVFPRLSILASYLRIFLKRSYRYTAYGLAILIILTGLASIITSFATCKPFSARYQGLESMGAHCYNTIPVFRWLIFVNILVDIVMMVLPLPIIWALQLSKKERIALMMIFLLGSV
jgi:hypothetical protein